MSKDITLAGRTFTGVNSIQIGSAVFLDADSAGGGGYGTTTMWTCEEALDTESNGKVAKTVKAILGGDPNTSTLYLIKVRNNVFNSNKDQYALREAIVIDGSYYVKRGNETVFHSTNATQFVGYINTGAECTITKITGFD